MPVWIVLEKAIKAFDPVRDALRIVEPIDPEDEATSAEAVLDLRNERRPRCIARHPGVNRCLDTDRECAHADPEPIDFVGAAASLPRPLRDQIASKIVGVVLRLESNEIVIGKASEYFLVRGQRLQNVGRGEWNMQKEPDLVLAAPGPQFATQRHEVVIVNPNDV